MSYVVADLDSGEILAAKSPHAWLRPASTLKALTALTLMPRSTHAAVVTASEDAQAAAGSRVGILAGNRYTVEPRRRDDDVLGQRRRLRPRRRRGRLRQDGRADERDRARDRRPRHGRGRPERPRRGRPALERLRPRPHRPRRHAAARLPGRRRQARRRLPGGKDKQGKVWKPFHIYNINELLRHYPGAIGIKPGRTDRAQHTFIGAATRGGRTLVVTQMGSITGSWKPTAALLDWGFANADTVTPVGTLVAPGEADPPTPAALAHEPARRIGRHHAAG